MKVLIVNDYGINIGGAEVLTFALRDTMRQQGHDVRVFSSAAGAAAGALQSDFQCLGTLSPLRAFLQTVNPWAYVRLRRVLNEFKPDVVHVRMFLTQLSPMILPLLRRVPALYHVVWYRPVCPTGTKLLPTGEACQTSAGAACYHNGCLPIRDWIPLQFQLWLWRRWRHAFRRIVANSPAVQRSLIAEGLESVDLIHNGVVPGGVTRALAAQPLVGFAGRLIPEKGVDVLLRAFESVVRTLPEARLLIAGDGPAREELEALARSLSVGERVSFLGRVPRERLERSLSAVWVQVVPSRWAEPFGLVAAEAMMRGTAVIASETGGLVDIVEEGNTGHLVPPGDVTALADKLLELLRDRPKAEQMGDAGRMRAFARFTIARQCQEFLNLYAEMLNGIAPASTGWERGAGDSRKESLT
jgi:glycosyltransferase involved in cell wall biosynthesis